MKRFKSIVLGLKEVDSIDEPMLERVANLAKTNGARLRLISVIESVPGILQALIPSFTTMQSAIERERTEKLATLCERLKGAGVDVSATVAHGKPFVEIIREVLRSSHDLVVVAAHEPGNATERYFGSTSTRLLRKCPCALWVFKPGASTKFKRIMAAVNPAADEPEEMRLNDDLLELSLSLSEIEDAQLFVTHAWSVWGESLLHMRMTREELEGLVEDTRRLSAQSLDKLLNKSGVTIPDECVLLTKGEPEEAIPSSVKEHEIDLLVLGTVARTGIPGVVMGNTAERLLERIECSVLAIKPDGFVSPVSAI